MSKFSGHVVGLDVDGVILDYVSAIMNFAKKNEVRIGCTVPEMNSWSMQCAFPDLNSDEIWGLIEDFNSSPDFGCIEPIEGAIKTIDAIHKEFPGVSLVAVTSAGESDVTRQLRIQNLKDIPFDEINVIPLGVSKYDHLIKLPRGSAFVDDLMKNIRTSEDAQLTGVLFRQPYNVEDDHDRVAHKWEDVHNHLREIILQSTPAFA